ncbi:hypothetical protein PSA01_22330 [Pseudonocardia saturnea]|uniref:Uncharacterized protein n=1 Tax=Pseudonocardia saturnea TaxID=33909 RepID=A0ABQ0RX03_9PSEU|nr:hypothetical protein PSA01_22330 [Pseudonocardia saturnea]
MRRFVLVADQHLEQRVPGQRARWCDGVEHLVERGVLERERVQPGRTHAGEELPERRVAAGVGAHHDGVEEQADHVGGVGAALDDGHAEREIVTGPHPVQQRGDRGVQHQERGGAGAGGELLHRGGERVVHGERDHRAAMALHRGPGQVGRQGGLGGCPVEDGAPVPERGVRARRRIGRVAEAGRRGRDGVDVAGGRWQRRRSAREAGGVGGGEVVDQHGERPVVDRDVVQHQREQVLIGSGAQQRGPPRQLGGQVERGGRQLPDGVPGGTGPGGLAQRQLRCGDRGGGQHLLPRLAAVVGEQGAQCLVPGDDVAERDAQRCGVQRAGELHGQWHRVARVGLDPLQRPDPALGRRERGPVRAGHRARGGGGGPGGSFGGQQGRDLPDGRPVEHRLHGQPGDVGAGIRAQLLPQPCDQPEHLQRVPAGGEQVGVGVDRRRIGLQQLGDQGDHLPLPVGARDGGPGRPVGGRHRRHRRHRCTRYRLPECPVRIGGGLGEQREQHVPVRLDLLGGVPGGVGVDPDHQPGRVPGAQPGGDHQVAHRAGGDLVHLAGGVAEPDPAGIGLDVHHQRRGGLASGPGAHRPAQVLAAVAAVCRGRAQLVVHPGDEPGRGRRRAGPDPQRQHGDRGRGDPARRGPEPLHRREIEYDVRGPGVPPHQRGHRGRDDLHRAGPGGLRGLPQRRGGRRVELAIGPVQLAGRGRVRGRCRREGGGHGAVEPSGPELLGRGPARIGEIGRVGLDDGGELAVAGGGRTGGRGGGRTGGAGNRAGGRGRDRVGRRAGGSTAGRAGRRPVQLDDPAAEQVVAVGVEQQVMGAHVPEVVLRSEHQQRLAQQRFAVRVERTPYVGAGPGRGGHRRVVVAGEIDQLATGRPAPGVLDDPPAVEGLEPGAQPRRLAGRRRRRGPQRVRVE